MYRRLRSPVLEWAVKRGRLRYAGAMYRNEELRPAMRHLKQGGFLWYAPDQDMRGKDTVFAPFFGVPAATITATHQFARLSGCAVVPFFHRREGADYVLRVGAALPEFPSDRRDRRQRARQRQHRGDGARSAEPVPVDPSSLQAPPRGHGFGLSARRVLSPALAVGGSTPPLRRDEPRAAEAQFMAGQDPLLSSTQSRRVRRAQVQPASLPLFSPSLQRFEPGREQVVTCSGAALTDRS